MQQQRYCWIEHQIRGTASFGSHSRVLGSAVSFIHAVTNMFVIARDRSPRLVIFFFFLDSCEANACGGFIRNCFSLSSSILTDFT